MQNKTLEKELLESIKDFKIIAHGNDQEIIDKIMEVVKKRSLMSLENWLTNYHEKSVEWNSGYNVGLEKAIGVITDELK